MSRNTILIVEDEEVVAADLQSRLARMGYETAVPVPSGEAAIEAARTLRPALVLMDIMLAGAMDGAEAAAIIRRELDIPVVFLTAHSDSRTLERARQAEPHAYIVKPFDEANLRVALQLVPYRHALERRLKTINRWFAAALLHVGDAVIATNHSGEILFMNPPAEKLTGWPLEEAAGALALRS